LSEPTPSSNLPNVARASGIMMVSLLLSRVLGILRDTVMAAQFGRSVETDAYRLAFSIPDLLFFLIAGGALSSAFIPVFSEYLHTDRREDAWKVFSVVATLMSIVVGGFIVIAWIFALPLSQVVAPGKQGAELELIAMMSRILLPAQFAFFIGGLLIGVLYAHQKFAVPGLGPNIYNVGILFGALVISHFVVPGIVGMTWGALIGAFVGSFLIPLLGVRLVHPQFRPSLDWRHPGVQKVFKLMLPVMLGLSLPGVYGLIMQGFGSFYTSGINTALDLANKLMQAPLGVFGQSLALAVFPALTQFYAQRRMDRYREQLDRTLRTVLFLTLPVTVLFWIMASDVVALLFQYGKFGAADTAAVAPALQMFALGIAAWCLHPVLMRAFFSLQQSVAPVVLGTVTTAIFIGLIFALRGTGLGYLSLPLASSISAIVLVVLMISGLNRQLKKPDLSGDHPGPLDLREFLMTLAKGALAAALMGFVLWLGVQLLPAGEGGSRNLMALARIGLFGLAGAWVYYFVGKSLKMPETETITRALNRLNRKGSAPKSDSPQ